VVARLIGDIQPITHIGGALIEFVTLSSFLPYVLHLVLHGCQRQILTFDGFMKGLFRPNMLSNVLPGSDSRANPRRQSQRGSVPRVL
jgi:hypothetical protein